MDSGQRSWGAPFSGDFGDWHSDTPGGTPEDVQSQVQQLAQLRHEPSVRHERLRLLEERRAGGEDVVQFGYLPVEVGFDTQLVKGELLITRESLLGYPGGMRWKGPGQSAEKYVDTLGLQVAAVPHEDLAGRILRLVPDRELDARVLADTARNLRLRGFSASLSYITPTAPVHKHPPAPPPGTPGQAAPAEARLQPARPRSSRARWPR